MHIKLNAPSLIASAAAILVATVPMAAQSEDEARKGFVEDIDNMTEQNEDFRRVVYTAKNLQVVVMSLPPGEHIGLEAHNGDQFFRVEEGEGEVLIDGQRTRIGPGSAVVVPAGSQHDFFSTGKSELKLYTIYSPPQHRDGLTHHTKADAEREAE